MLMRLQKFLAEAGVASRRHAELLISAGRVLVNGQKVTEMGVKVDPVLDLISVDGHMVEKSSRKRVIMLNKPVGYVCSSRKVRGEDNIFDLIDVPERLFSVGRLDKESSGLILLTNDGDLALRLTHPSQEKEKEYWVRIHKPVTPELLDQLRNGVEIPGGKTKPCPVLKREADSFKIVLKEGRKRQIREMCGACGYAVIGLHRVRINDLILGDLPSKQWRDLTQTEIEKL